MPILKTAPKNMPGGPLSLRPARRSFIDFQSGGEGSAKMEQEAILWKEQLTAMCGCPPRSRMRPASWPPCGSSRDQRPGEVATLPGVQQGHIQHHDGGFAFFGDETSSV